MRSSAWILMVLATGAIAQSPTISARDEADWASPVESYFETLGRHIVKARAQKDYTASCDPSKAVMPTAPTPLPPPKEGLTLSFILIGRGTQNYTCASSNSSDLPVSVGALASLYDAKCAAASYPDLLSLLPNLALQFTKPSGSSSLQPSGLVYIGEHYFTNATTPTFNLNTPQHQDGLSLAAKNASSPAPSDAPKGPGGVGYGAVPWLKLISKDGSTGPSEIYRLNTAGGNPPPNCQGLNSSFVIQYSAEYWMYS